MSGEVKAWEPNMQHPQRVTAGRQSPRPPARDSYPAPLPHPGPYVVQSGIMEEASLRTRLHAPSQSKVPQPPQGASKEQMHRFAGLGVGLTSVVAEHVLSHPCIVLRRQCQVHHDSLWYHLTPFSLFQTIFHLQTNQSVTALWKGIGSTLMVKGMQVATETVISEVSPLPREITRHSSIKKMAQHLVLKSVGFVLTCPFYAASLVETVQSEIASERPGVFDCLREGMSRLVSLSTPQTTRQLPVWKLFVPFAMYGVCHYVLSSLAQYTVLLSVRSDIVDRSPVKESSSQRRSLIDTYYPELIAAFTGSLLADVALYPLETVVHRLLLQGTRTIIDNTDTGLSVVPIVTRYEGMVDCFRSIIVEEGFAGFYKGFGALVLQYACHAALLKMTKTVFDLLAQTFGDNGRPRSASDVKRQLYSGQEVPSKPASKSFPSQGMSV